jgi:PAS domain S-box-containing protein
VRGIKGIDERLTTAAGAELVLRHLASAIFPEGEHHLEQLFWPEGREEGGAEDAESAEARLHVVEQRMRTLVEQIPAVTFMAVLGKGKNELYVSPHIEHMLGYTQEEWLADPFLWYFSLHPDDRKLWTEEFARGCQEGGPFRAQCRFIARDGRVVWVHGEARVVKDELGRPELLQGVAFDITETHVGHEARLKQALRDARAQEELAISQRIQTALQPRGLAVPGLEISGKTIPAGGVGGDFYDVFPDERGAWISIGDVSGRTLDAGLMLLMLQGALHATVQARSADGPSAILRLVQDALVHNIRARLGTREHLNLSLLRYTTDGSIVHAGAHEELVIYRRRADAIETAVPGTLMRGRKDVGQLLVDLRLQLDDGDLLLLHSDGVTGAANDDGRPFELDGLTSVLRPLISKPVLLIRDNILQAVKRYASRQEDDMTLVVMRYRAR